MRIDKTNPAGMIQAYNKTNPGQAEKMSRKPMGRDEVKISDEAIELLKYGEEQETDPVREAKIIELKQQVQQGTYRVPSDKIAEKFLAFWKKSGRSD
ncbi:flagellar biosynthesis anti-sigma factor FlgM [Brevibacillus massiliensis]|uniref:flagellar biosynthesis anti-sigma factor FlgM n=1 Tax=Brevibacillus massiliensis TaxID=1118054 RepID=UPI0002D34BEF|nr:flagellar biosynthesis anti-sigma factor FlgM [Brevibacillus massiliensis]